MSNNSWVNKILPFFLFLLLMAGGCKSHKKNMKDQYDDYASPVEVTIKDKGKKKKSTSTGQKIAEESIDWIGTPYGFGRSEKGIATDCSGLVVVVYKEIADVKLPRNSAEQADFCDDVKEKDIEAGDLVFFATGKDRRKVSHVGVMIDGFRFVHASGSKGVIMSEMTTPYYRRNFIKYGRVPQIKR